MQQASDCIDVCQYKVGRAVTVATPLREYPCAMAETDPFGEGRDGKPAGNPRKKPAEKH